MRHMARPAGHQLNRFALDDVLALTGLSLTGVAEMSDIPRSTLSSLRGGFHRASVPQAHKIAAAVGVQVQTLFPSMIPAKDDAA